jgi:hypothetical protein
MYFWNMALPKILKRVRLFFEYDFYFVGVEDGEEKK